MLHALVHDFTHDSTQPSHIITCLYHLTVKRCTRARLHAFVHNLTCDLNLMLARFNRRALKVDGCRQALIHANTSMLPKSTCENEHHVTSTLNMLAKIPL